MNLPRLGKPKSPGLPPRRIYPKPGYFPAQAHQHVFKPRVIVVAGHVQRPDLG